MMLCTSCKITISNTFCGTTAVFEYRRNDRFCMQNARRVDKFHTCLRSLAQTCSFADTDFEIEQQIIMPGTSLRIRRKALRDPAYVLKDILVDGRRDEQSTYQARDIESKEFKSDNLNEVRSKQ